MVTGRAGWMGMGRGAGRSALGLWPTLAFLLCSFPAGKAQLPGRETADRARSWASLRELGPLFTSPLGTHISFSMSLCPVPCGGSDRCQWRPGSERLPARAPKGRSRICRAGECLSVPLPPYEKSGALDSEARIPYQGHFLQLLAHQFAKPFGSPGVELGALGRSQMSP